MPRTMRARPVRFSDRTGLRLCGIADEPFWPGEKYSSASRTSVRCRWRISVASRSIDEAMTPSVAKNMAWRSRGMTWVETGSAVSPSFSATCASTRGSILAKVPTAPEMAQVAISAARRDEPLAVARELGVVPGELQAEGGRLGMDAVAAADGRRVTCARWRGASARPAARRDRRAAGRRPALSCTARQVSSTSDEVMP